jgi:hypothetical protein
MAKKRYLAAKKRHCHNAALCMGLFCKKVLIPLPQPSPASNDKSAKRTQIPFQPRNRAGAAAGSIALPVLALTGGQKIIGALIKTSADAFPKTP